MGQGRSFGPEVFVAPRKNNNSNMCFAQALPRPPSIFSASLQSTRRQTEHRQPDDVGTQDCKSLIPPRFADTSSDLLFESFFSFSHEQRRPGAEGGHPGPHSTATA